MAGRMPSVSDSSLKAAKASSSVTATYSARRLSLRKLCSGPPGIIETRRDAMSLRDLAVYILHKV